MARQIYRKEALDQLASPDQLDQLMQLTSPRGWWALVGIGLLLALAVVWGVLGTLKTQVMAEGVLQRPADTTLIEAPARGTVRKFLVQNGDEVVEGQPLVEFQTAGATDLVSIKSPHKGRVEILALEATDLEKDVALASIEEPRNPLEATLFVSTAEGFQIEPGMDVQIIPAIATRNDSQHLRGRVVQAGRRPATRDSMLQVLGSEDWIHSITAAGPVLRIDIELTEVVPEIPSGTPCQGLITTSEHRPIELLLPTSQN